MRNIREKIHIGTSGWSYDHWHGRFYPEDLPSSERFEHYAGVFGTVEINNTFYQLPEVETFDEWKNQAPRGFLYAVKANRFITHMKKLKDSKEALGRLFERSRRLGSHLGPILYQLPPHWNPNIERLAAFCGELPGDLSHVIEFRERDWLNEDVYEVLREHDVGLCVHDLLPRHPRRATADHVYIRLHGSGKKYGGSYRRSRLESWAGWMKEMAGDGREVYAYFNNDEKGFAARNARSLKEILGVD